MQRRILRRLQLLLNRATRHVIDYVGQDTSTVSKAFVQCLEDEERKMLEDVYWSQFELEMLVAMFGDCE
jgi:hypothetical protein